MENDKKWHYFLPHVLEYKMVYQNITKTNKNNSLPSCFKYIDCCYAHQPGQGIMPTTDKITIVKRPSNVVRSTISNHLIFNTLYLVLLAYGSYPLVSMALPSSSALVNEDTNNGIISVISAFTLDLILPFLKSTPRDD